MSGFARSVAQSCALTTTEQLIVLLKLLLKPLANFCEPTPAAAASNTRNTTMPEEIANPLPEDRCVIVVTGPIGYGKSRFIRRHLLPALAQTAAQNSFARTPLLE